MSNSFSDLRFDDYPIGPEHEEDRWKPVPPPNALDDSELYYLRARKPSIHALIAALHLERKGVFSSVIPENAAGRIVLTRTVVRLLLCTAAFIAVLLASKYIITWPYLMVPVFVITTWSLLTGLRATNRFFAPIERRLVLTRRESRAIGTECLFENTEPTPAYPIHDIDDRTVYVRQWMVYGWPRDWRGSGHIETYHDMPWAMFYKGAGKNTIDYERWDYRDRFEWDVMYSIEFRLLRIQAVRLLMRLNPFGLYILFARFALNRETRHCYIHFFYKEFRRAIQRRAKRKALRERLHDQANRQTAEDPNWPFVCVVPVADCSAS